MKRQMHTKRMGILIDTKLVYEFSDFLESKNVEREINTSSQDLDRIGCSRCVNYF